MGDFDRNAKPAEGAQTKKLIMVGVLAAVLLGVVGMQLLKGPASAEASTGQPDAGGAPAAQAADESPDVLRAALFKDPTPTLLADGPRSKTIAPAERNPFAMSRAWRLSVTPKEPTLDPQPQVVTQTQVEPTAVGPAPIVLKADDYKLSMILSSGGQWIALLNGTTVSAGSKIRDAIVVEVRSDAVVLRPKDSEQGRRMELLLNKPN